MTNKTTSANDLVERLEGEADGLLSAELGRFPLPAGPAANVMREAADTITRLQAALRMFIGSAYPVATEINGRGYNWCEAYLDSARVEALAALSSAGGE